MDEPFNINKQDKNLPFKVPENYFNELPTKISSRVQKRPPLISWPFQPKIKRALASLVILLTFGIIFWNYQINTISPDTNTLLAEIPSENIMAYLEEAELYNFELYAEFDPSDEFWNELLIEEFQDYEDVPEIEFLNEDLDMYFLNLNDQ